MSVKNNRCPHFRKFSYSLTKADKLDMQERLEGFTGASPEQSDLNNEASQNDKYFLTPTTSRGICTNQTSNLQSQTRATSEGTDGKMKRLTSATTKAES